MLLDLDTVAIRVIHEENVRLVVFGKVASGDVLAVSAAKTTRQRSDGAHRARV